ncbi:CHAD domain-containing protein [Desulfogranum marinum]|uniref:CHAD domain-containing protein n=1 Tax=Desulfogranum marinum TaxID=453220 RepID=UPI001962E405|nr:CHAD domain-containing protein [Desulfogranum marinum]MBM9514044.1 CHAD domain-containing protein [Desulfogranum marinum]
MGYQLEKGKNIEDAVHSVAEEQVIKAIDELRDLALDPHPTVHQVRKRCKKLRGLIRLIRPTFDAYRQENVFLRDAARELSSIRDAQSIIESVDSLQTYYAGQVDERVFHKVRQELIARRQRITDDQEDMDQRLEIFLGKMHKLEHRIEEWQVNEEGYAAVADGLRKTFRRGRKYFSRAYLSPSTERFHEWRKLVKYHWYHLRLLHGIWPEMLTVQEETADKLADALGDDHDLDVLLTTVLTTPDAFGDDRQRQVLYGLIDRRRHSLRTDARLLGTYLFAEKPGSQVRRFGTYWEMWQKQ